MNQSTIKTKGIGKRYGGLDGSDEPSTWAVKGVSLEVYAGQVTMLMGPSGSGKTTLLSMVGGLLTPTKGQLTICGQQINGRSESYLQSFRREHIGFIFQSCNLLSSLTAAENIQVALSLRDKDEDGALLSLFDVGLSEKAEAFPHQLSGGQRQRVAIARAIAGDPPIVLADEPTAALDAGQGRIIMELLRRRAHEAGTTVLVVTHDPRVREIADRVIEMEDGHLKRVVRRKHHNRPETKGLTGRSEDRKLKEAAHV